MSDESAWAFWWLGLLAIGVPTLGITVNCACENEKLPRHMWIAFAALGAWAGPVLIRAYFQVLAS